MQREFKMDIMHSSMFMLYQNIIMNSADLGQYIDYESSSFCVHLYLLSQPFFALWSYQLVFNILSLAMSAMFKDINDVSEHTVQTVFYEMSGFSWVVSE